MRTVRRKILRRPAGILVPDPDLHRDYPESGWWDWRGGDWPYR